MRIWNIFCESVCPARVIIFTFWVCEDYTSFYIEHKAGLTSGNYYYYYHYYYAHRKAGVLM